MTTVWGFHYNTYNRANAGTRPVRESRVYTLVTRTVCCTAGGGGGENGGIFGVSLQRPADDAAAHNRFLLLTASISAAASSLRRFTRRPYSGDGDWPPVGHVCTKHGGRRRLARVTVAEWTVAHARAGPARAGARVCTL